MNKPIATVAFVVLAAVLIALSLYVLPAHFSNNFFVKGLVVGTIVVVLFRLFHGYMK